MRTEIVNKSATDHAALRTRLIADFSLADDEQTLADTLEGISDFNKLLAALAREALYEAAQAEACNGLMKKMQARKDRRSAKAEKLRAAIKWAMGEAGERKINAPDMTISISAGAEKFVIIVNAGPDAPPEYVKTTTIYSWDAPAVKAGVDSFDLAAMEIGYYANPEPTLTIRTK